MGLTKRELLTVSTPLLGLAPLISASESEKLAIDNKGKKFRDYDSAPDHVIRFYKEHHAQQTYEFAKTKSQFYGQLKQGQSTAWDMLERLDKINDTSDPDINLSQMEHAYQVAENMKAAGVSEAMIVAGLIHDMGKALIFWGEPQWAVVGDTYPVGLRFSETIVQFDALKNNPDNQIEKYQSDYGIYHPGIGIDNVMMTWGHDEYLYQILKSQSRLSEEALFAIRYHSCYPLHRAKEPRYLALLNNQDRKYMDAVELLNSHDLYSKSDSTSRLSAKTKSDYRELVEYYVPGKLNW